METKALNIEFNGRRELNSSRKKTMYISGLIVIIYGLLGMVISGFDLNVPYLILTIAGVLNIVHAFWGKELRKERNFISINGEEIEYKNSFKPPKKIKISDLLDIRIETAKVEFVHNDQRVESYNFSVFQRQELEDIYKELERVKANLIE
jgi:hypothetical protein